MKKVMIIALLIVGMVFIPAVSAETIIDEDINVYKDYSEKGEQDYSGGSPGWTANGIRIENIERYEEIKYIGFTWFINNNALSEGTNELTYTLNGTTNTCRIHIQKNRNFLGTVTATQALIFFDNWDIGTLHGTQIVTFSQAIYNGKSWSGSSAHVMSPVDVYKAGQNPEDPRTCIIVGGIDSYNHLTVNEDGGDYEINLKREYPNKDYYSKIEVKLIDDIILSDYHHQDFFNIIRKTDTDRIEITLNDDLIIFPLEGEVPDDGRPEVRVYVRNAQTGALLANAHINISASVNDTLHEVINETIPSGTATYTLKPTGGGLPNPDYYRLITSLEGYNSIMPYIDFEHGSATTLIVQMEPTTGGPADDNMTFIEFYVRDIYTNPISGASVTCGGYTLITNSAGYTQFEMPVNSAYSYKVSKTGYLTIEGIATVESDDRYVVNVALMAGVVPTQTVVTPTITVEPTPTQTTPPIQEDNLIGLSVKGLAKGFGIDYDTALLMFGLMIIFGAGGMVMSSVKGGAMEFIAGSIVGTFVAFALGLIPIWIFIIIAVVFGAYVLRVFVQGSQ